jgi:hypothetical protein
MNFYVIYISMKPKRFDSEDEALAYARNLAMRPGSRIRVIPKWIKKRDTAPVLYYYVKIEK